MSRPTAPRLHPAILVGPELLPCPDCGGVSRANSSAAEVEEVRCQKCTKLLRRRPPLTPEQRLQALTLRWAAAELERPLRPRHGVKRTWHSNEEVYDNGVAGAAEKLRDWARTVHKRPSLRE